MYRLSAAAAAGSWSQLVLCTPSQNITQCISVLPRDVRYLIFSARCNIYDVSVRLSVRLSVTEVHWRINHRITATTASYRPLTPNRSQLMQRDPRDAVLHAHRAVCKAGL